MVAAPEILSVTSHACIFFLGSKEFSHCIRLLEQFALNLVLLLVHFSLEENQSLTLNVYHRL